MNTATTWRTSAACRALGRWGIFFPEADTGYDCRPAKAVCSTCPVQAPCLADALARPPGEDYGVYGGTTRKERLRLRHYGAVSDDPATVDAAKAKAAVADAARAPSPIHATATVDAAVVCRNVVIGEGAHVGSKSFVCSYVTIDAGAHVGAFVFVGRGARVGCGAYVGDGVRLPTGARVAPYAVVPCPAFMKAITGGAT